MSVPCLGPSPLCDDSLNTSGLNVSVNTSSHQLLRHLMCANMQGKCEAEVANALNQIS